MRQVNSTDGPRKGAEIKVDEATLTLNEVMESLPKRYRDILLLYERGQSSLSPDALDKPVVMRLLPDGTPVKPTRTPSPSVATPEKPSILDRVSSRFGGGSSATVNKDVESTFSPLHSILIVRAAIRVARLLAGLVLMGASFSFEGGGDWHQPGSSTFLPSFSDRTNEDRLNKPDVSTWLIKASSVLIQNSVLISVEERCWASSAIALIYGSLGMRRKWSFHLRVACLTIIDELRKGPRGGIVVSSALAALPPETQKQSVGVSLVQLLTHVASVQRLFDDKGSSRTTEAESSTSDPFFELRQMESRDDYSWLLREADAAKSKILGIRPFVPSQSMRVWRDHRSRVHYGWPDLQLDIVREAIELGSILDYPTVSYDFLCLMIRRFHLVLSPRESMDAVRQLGTAYGDIQDEEVAATEDKSIPRLSVGVPVIVSLSLERPAPARLLHLHRVPVESAEQIDEDVPDAFIYNPYDEKLADKTGPGDVACNESITAVLTLANPLDVDLPLSKVSIWTSGARFEANVMGCLLPAQARHFALQLTGMPLEPGELDIRGIKVQTIGGIEEELQPAADLPPRPEEERERLLGKANLAAIPTLSSRQVSSASQFASTKPALRITVLPQQPILECTDSSLGTQNILTLFEGEEATFTLTVVNAGRAAMDSLVVTFKDEYEPSSTTKDGPEAPEDIYEREVHEKSIRAFHLAGSDSGKRQLLKEPLVPGSSRTISVSCLGRRRCIGTTVVVEYSGPRPDPAEYHTRILVIPVILTVLKAVEAVAIAALPYADLTGDPDAREKKRTHFLLAIDVKNAASEAFRVQIGRNTEPQAIQGGAIKRFYLPFPRKTPDLEPRAIPASEGQFVLTRVLQFSPAESGLRSKLFWYREQLFGGLHTTAEVHAEWSLDPDRKGLLDLRRLKVGRDALECLEVAELHLGVDVSSSDGDLVTTEQDTVECHVGQHVELQWTVTNTSRFPVSPVFCTEIVEAGGNTRVAWLGPNGEPPALFASGAPTVLLSQIEPTGASKHKTTVVPFKTGRYEVRYHALGRVSEQGKRTVHQPSQPLLLLVLEAQVAVEGSFAGVAKAGGSPGRS